MDPKALSVSVMLDSFEILTTSGVVIWSRTFSPVNPSIINSFVNDVFIEEKAAASGAKDDVPASQTTPYRTEQHTLKWTFVKELGIIFVVRVVVRCAWCLD